VSYWDEVYEEEADALEREREYEETLEREWYEELMAEHVRELQQELEDGWREDIARQEYEKQACAQERDDELSEETSWR
jgi:hypothetical protein